LDRLDVNSMTPIEAINILYEWKQRFGKSDSNKKKTG